MEATLWHMARPTHSHTPVPTWRCTQRQPLGWVTRDRYGTGCVAACVERERTAGVRTHESLAHAEHQLTNGRALVAGHWVGRVKHKRILCRDDLWDARCVSLCLMKMVYESVCMQVRVRPRAPPVGGGTG